MLLFFEQFTHKTSNISTSLDTHLLNAKVYVIFLFFFLGGGNIKKCKTKAEYHTCHEEDHFSAFPLLLSDRQAYVLGCNRISESKIMFYKNHGRGKLFNQIFNLHSRINVNIV